MPMRLPVHPRLSRAQLPDDERLDSYAVKTNRFPLLLQFSEAPLLRTKDKTFSTQSSDLNLNLRVGKFMEEAEFQSVI